MLAMGRCHRRRIRSGDYIFDSLPHFEQRTSCCVDPVRGSDEDEPVSDVFSPLIAATEVWPWARRLLPPRARLTARVVHD